jgi:hypothetical protein
VAARSGVRIGANRTSAKVGEPVGEPDRRAVPLWTTYAGLPVHVVRKPCSQGEIQLTSVALSHRKSPFLITVVVLV